MKGLAAGLIFMCAATVCGVFIGLAGAGLRPVGAAFSLCVGLLFAFAAWLATNDPPTATESPPVAFSRSSRIWLWLVVSIFALFALRSFCWLFYIEGAEWKIQSPNNLGDLALHITYIKTFANAVPLWPDNPIYVASKMRYPAGVDLFNALLCLVGVDLAQGLVWVGLLGSIATCYALWRWGRTFAMAGFLFNGGVFGFVFLHKLFFNGAVEFQDYQGANDVTWKSIPLSMFVTQRGWLYAIPAGLLLLWNWRNSYFTTEQGKGDGVSRPRLAFPVELALYASMPLFHVHTFLALSAVLAVLFVGGDRRIRSHLGRLVGASFLPATFFVWLVSDNFQAHSMVAWSPGWVRNDQALQRSSFFDFWFSNFGVLLPLVLLLLGLTVWRCAQHKPKIKIELLAFGSLMAIALTLWRTWTAGIEWQPLLWLLAGFALLAWSLSRRLGPWISDEPAPGGVVFLTAAAMIFLTGMLFKFAPWEWDNLKLMIWAYFILLPFLWERLIAAWSTPVRTGVCIALFGSGFVSLFGGLAAGAQGYTLINRAELDGVGAGASIVPMGARFASYPTYNHPLLLQGRKVVMGYPGHLWTQGFDDYQKVENALRNLMMGAGNWHQTAQGLGVRYLFWGPEEKMNYAASTRPWEAVAPIVAAGDWGVIYDLEALEPNAPRSLGSQSQPSRR
jgi:hypothetical protein